VSVTTIEQGLQAVDAIIDRARNEGRFIAG